MSIFHINSSNSLSTPMLARPNEPDEKNDALAEPLRPIEINEILFDLLEHVPIADLFNVALTCRQWSQVVKEPAFCIRRMRLDFPFSPVPARDVVAVYQSRVKDLLTMRKRRPSMSIDPLRSKSCNFGLGAVHLTKESVISGSLQAKLARPGIYFRVNPEGGRARMHISTASALSMQQGSLVSGHPNGEICRWEFNSPSNHWQQTHTLRNGVYKITAILEGGGFLFAGDVVGRIHMWNRQGQQICSSFAHIQEIRSLHRRDGSLFSAGKEGKVFEWKATPAGLEKKSEFSSGRSPIQCLHFFHDDLLAADENGTIAIWHNVEGELWEQKGALKQGDFPITALASHENFVFSANDQGGIKVWEYERGSWNSYDLSKKPLDPEQHVIGFSYEADRRRLHCAHFNGQVSVWDFSSSPASLIR